MAGLGLRLGLGAGGRRRAWTPARLPALALWLDPRAGCYVERTGPATTCGDGDPVGTWAARVGPAFVAPSDSRRPIWRANAGTPYLQFDGVDDVLTASTLDLTGNTGLTAAAAARLTAAGSFPMIFLPRSATYSAVYAELRGFSASGRVEWNVNSLQSVTAASQVGAGVSLVGTYDGAATRLYLNGADTGTGSSAAATIAATGPAFVGGRDTSGSLPLTGRVGDVVCATAALAAADRALLVAFLGGRLP